MEEAQHTISVYVICTGQENQISDCSKLDYFSTPDWCSSRNNIVGITCRDGKILQLYGNCFVKVLKFKKRTAVQF